MERHWRADKKTIAFRRRLATGTRKKWSFEGADKIQVQESNMPDGTKQVSPGKNTRICEKGENYPKKEGFSERNTRA